MLVALAFLLVGLVQGALHFSETTARITISNGRLTASLNKSVGAIDTLVLDSQNLLGTKVNETGIGPYLDCNCVPSAPKGFYTPFKSNSNTTYTLLQGTDSTGIGWAGIIQSELYAPTGQLFQQYFFLRDNENGLHTFTRIAYQNADSPPSLGELRTLFRPNTQLWTHLSTNPEEDAPLPYYNPAAPFLNVTGKATMVQDATWFLPNTSDPYVKAYSSYFTKYTFSDSWRDHTVHGLYSDGSRSIDGATYGAWFVMGTVDTYFGGPTHSDLTVDGIVYNYLVSNHHGNQTPKTAKGFDRTFGPGFYYFNKGRPGDSLRKLRGDAEAKFMNAKRWTAFYDSIAKHVPGYVPSSGRGAWTGKIKLPKGAANPIAILSVSGVDYQDNAVDGSAYQYWSKISRDGSVTISHVKAGTYRLTIYADGIFGQYTQDNIKISAGRSTKTTTTWTPESAGTELWRIGIPDKSSGEYRHGNHPDPTHPLHPAERRIYYAVYDFVSDFPHGVSFHVSKSSIAKDFNYVHWSVVGGSGNSIRPDVFPGNGNVNNWTILFDLNQRQLAGKTKATFTIQLAGAKTAAGNTDVFNATEKYSNVPYRVNVNGHDLDPWIIPYHQSSSCAVRSAVSCYNLAHKFVFDAQKLLMAGRNSFVLSLPHDAKDHETAKLFESVYVQYDAMRLEVA